MTSTQSPTLRRHSRRATATVELALCLPFFIATTLYCVDVAGAYHGQMVVDAAAWRGANAAATKRFTPESYDEWREYVETNITEEMATIDHFNPENLAISLDDHSENDRVTIDVGVTYVGRTMIAWPISGGRMTYRRNLSIRQYR